eukprot:scpid91625/ scgid4054/ 
MCENFNNNSAIQLDEGSFLFSTLFENLRRRTVSFVAGEHRHGGYTATTAWFSISKRSSSATTVASSSTASCSTSYGCSSACGVNAATTPSSCGVNTTPGS